jgi:[ribosomal protein S5]-alanine N-acetyltransferase
MSQDTTHRYLSGDSLKRSISEMGADVVKPTFDFSYFPEISTSRLLLRCFQTSDVDALFAIRGDFEVTKYNIGPAYTKRKQAENLISGSLSKFSSKEMLYWAITLRETGEFIGQIGFNSWDVDNHSGEVGFDLSRCWWRKGIMTEALGAVIRFGVQEMKLNRINAGVSTYNDACKALLRGHNFKHEGTQKEQYFENGSYHDLDLFALLARDRRPDFLEAPYSLAYQLPKRNTRKKIN